MSQFVTLGEIMLRLKSPGHERFFQSPSLEATFGGGESNVAVALANYGLDAGFVTALPGNDIAEACIREVRSFGVDTSNIVRCGDRIGIYFLEAGSNQRPSKVVYDRAGSWQCEVVSYHGHYAGTERKRGRVVDGSLQGGEGSRCNRVLRLQLPR